MGAEALNENRKFILLMLFGYKIVRTLHIIRFKALQAILVSLFFVIQATPK